MQDTNSKIDSLILLIQKQQEDNHAIIKKADNRKQTDSLFIKVASALVAGAAIFVITNIMDINKRLYSKADKYALAEKLSSTAYALSEGQRAELLLNYIDYASHDYLIRDEELHVLERGRVEKSLKSMVQAVTTRGE